jgi:hypothetical protein
LLLENEKPVLTAEVAEVAEKTLEIALIFSASSYSPR